MIPISLPRNVGWGGDIMVENEQFQEFQNLLLQKLSKLAAQVFLNHLRNADLMAGALVL